MTFESFLPVIITGVGSFLVTYVFAKLKFRDDLQAKYDESLRNERIEVYKKLWALLEPLAKYSRPAPVTSDTLKDLSAKLREWYFKTGGIFLTDNSRNTYFALQDELQKIIKDGPADIEKSPLFEELRDKGSKLRKSLATDVRTRVKSSIASEDVA